MDINRSSSSRFKINKSLATSPSQKSSDPSRVKSASNTEHNIKAELKEGQMIKGQIIDHRYNEVKVKVEPDGQIITAKLSNDSSLAIGQNASFIVSEVASDGIVLKHIPGQASPNESMILKALAAAGITITDRNKAIVEELLNQKMPIDKQTIQTLIKYSIRHRDASPLSLVLMYKNNIPINSGNLQQFQSYLNGTHQLLTNIKDITQSLSKLLTAPPNTETINKAINIELGSNDINPQLTNSILHANPDALVDSHETNPLNSINTLNSEVANNNLSTVDEKVLSKALNINDKLLDIYLSNTDTALLQPDLKTIDLLNNDTLLENQNQTQLMATQADKLSDIMTNNELTSLLTNLSDTADINGIKASIADGTASINDTLAFIQKALTSANNNNIVDLLTSPEYTKLLDKAFYKKWTITPDNVANKNAVEAFYKQLDSDLDEIKRLISAAVEADEYSPIQKPLNQLQDNLQFMKDLNNAFSFLQLPVEFKDRELHTDLYVMTKKKSLNDKNENLKVHLHLETANLGSLNIDLQMMGKQLETIFYPGSNEVAKIIKDNLPELVLSLQTKGYSVKADVSTNLEEVGLFKRLIEQNIQDNNITKYAFDIRT